MDWMRLQKNTIKSYDKQKYNLQFYIFNLLLNFDDKNCSAWRHLVVILCSNSMEWPFRVNVLNSYYITILLYNLTFYD